MPSILVTGGAGFIGSHLCEALLLIGYKVITIDSFNDYYNPVIKRKNIEAICSNAKVSILNSDFTVYEGDIRDSQFLERVFSENDISLVVHLAACAGVRPSIQNPILYYDVNVNGTLNILECMKKYYVKQLVFASSSSVYGNNKKVPFSENDFVDNPISPYATTKRSGELLCYTYHHLFNINTACLRFFTVYGPRQRPDLAIHKFTRLMLENKAIPFYGDGNTQRDYTFIDDIIDGIIKAMNWVSANDTKYEIFNLGESRTISLLNLVTTLEDVLKTKAILNISEKQQGDVEITYADISKAQEILGYNPKYDFYNGITKFIEWYMNNQK